MKKALRFDLHGICWEMGSCELWWGPSRQVEVHLHLMDVDQGQPGGTSWTSGVCSSHSAPCLLYEFRVGSCLQVLLRLISELLLEAEQRCDLHLRSHTSPHVSTLGPVCVSEGDKVSWTGVSLSVPASGLLSWLPGDGRSSTHWRRPAAQQGFVLRHTGRWSSSESGELSSCLQPPSGREEALCCVCELPASLTLSPPLQEDGWWNLLASSLLWASPGKGRGWSWGSHADVWRDRTWTGLCGTERTTTTTTTTSALTSPAWCWRMFYWNQPPGCCTNVLTATVVPLQECLTWTGFKHLTTSDQFLNPRRTAAFSLHLFFCLFCFACSYFWLLFVPLDWKYKSRFFYESKPFI